MSETAKLIEAVKARPVLYATTHPHNKNRAKRIATWEEIAREMGDGSACIWSAKWKGLRDNYAKYKKTTEPGGAVLYRKYKNWPWAENLKFLDKYTVGAGGKKIRVPPFSPLTMTNNCEQPQFCNVQLFVDPNLNAPVDQMQDPVLEGSDYKTIENNSRTRKYKPDTGEEAQEYAQLNRNEDKPTLDGIDHFFLSYAQSFKSLPNRMQIMLKLDIATLFSRYELQAEGVSSEAVDAMPRIVHPVKCEFEYTDNEIGE